MELSPYIVSFSFLEDNLTMWRYYNSQICIILDKDRLIEDCKMKSYHFSKFKYCAEYKEEIKKVLSEISKEMKISANNILEKARKCYAFIKYIDFKNEKEFRVGQFDHYTYDKDSTTLEVRVYPLPDHDLILYKDLILIKNYEEF